MNNKFQTYKNLYLKGKLNSENISNNLYNELYNNNITIYDEININNNIQKELGYTDRIIYYTKNNKTDNLNKNFDDLFTIINPYYTINNYGNKEYYNDNTITTLTDDIYDYKYDVLKYIFEDNI